MGQSTYVMTQFLLSPQDLQIYWKKGGRIHATRKNKEALVVSNKQTGTEENAEQTKYMIMSRDKYPGQNHNIKIHKTAFESVGQFIYLGTILTNQNSIHEDINSMTKSWIACYHSVQSYSLLSKNIKIKI
jgi:hypothetical protein